LPCRGGRTAELDRQNDKAPRDVFAGALEVRNHLDERAVRSQRMPRAMRCSRHGHQYRHLAEGGRRDHSTAAFDRDMPSGRAIGIE
jgi:hypothetical protein